MLVDQVIEILKKELGNWLESHSDTISKSPITDKSYPILCGSSVEGFLTEGCDVDFALIFDNRQLRFDLKTNYSNFYDGTSERLQNECRLKGLCRFSRTPWTSDWIVEFKRCRNPVFRYNYFLFGRLLSPNNNTTRVDQYLATVEDFIHFKRRLQSNFRNRYGLKLPTLKQGVLEITRYSPKTLYRHIQLIVNAFLMTYGLSNDKLTEKMEEELKEKSIRIVKSTVMRKAQKRIIQNLETSNNRILALKRRKTTESRLKWKRLRYMMDHGLISEDECQSIKNTMTFLVEYVYQPLHALSEVHTVIVDILGYNSVRWFGLRRTHAYITLDGLEPLRYIDILRSENGFNLFVGVTRSFKYKPRVKGYETIFEDLTTSGPLDIPEKTHSNSGNFRRRVHFKLTSLTNDDLRSKEKTRDKLFKAISRIRSL